nr:hypothetical protein [Serratia fonticola]
MKDVNAIDGADFLGQAIARRVSVGKRVLLAEPDTYAAAKILRVAGF